MKPCIRVQTIQKCLMPSHSHSPGRGRQCVPPKHTLIHTILRNDNIADSRIECKFKFMPGGKSTYMATYFVLVARSN